MAAVGAVLRERDGVALDDAAARAQLDSGGFLILFDGLSEVRGEQSTALREILRCAESSEFERCRFVVSTRPLEAMPGEARVLQLRPLTSETVALLLPQLSLTREQEVAVRDHLRAFGGEAVQPLMLVMLIAESRSTAVGASRATLYESYFRRLLGVEHDAVAWLGWRHVLESIAAVSLLESGRIGIGLTHRQLIEVLSTASAGATVVESLRKFYGLHVTDEISLLKALERVGVMEAGPRWKFAHDTFEEFFAASYLASALNGDHPWPPLTSWRASERGEREFAGVLEFLDQIAPPEAKMQARARLLPLPAAWQERFGSPDPT